MCRSVRDQLAPALSHCRAHDDLLGPVIRYRADNFRMYVDSPYNEIDDMTACSIQDRRLFSPRDTLSGLSIQRQERRFTPRLHLSEGTRLQEVPAIFVINAY